MFFNTLFATAQSFEAMQSKYLAMSANKVKKKNEQTWYPNGKRMFIIVSSVDLRSLTLSLSALASCGSVEPRIPFFLRGIRLFPLTAILPNRVY
jgi:hypothetical protein